MKRLSLAVVAAAALASVVPANAATYVLNYTATNGSPLPTTGNFTVVTADVLNGSGGYDILSASGSFTANSITYNVSLAPLNPPGFSTDNVYYAADPHFTTSGIGFQFAGGFANLWGNGAGQPYSFYAFNGESYFVGTDGALGVTGVPEPGIWLMLLAGFAMVGIAARRRAMQAA